jgi:small subunit ribosomal protein S20
LAHNKSAIKRWRQSLERRARNRSVKSRTRTLVTKAIMTIGGASAESEESVRSAVSALDKAAQKGVIHANAAARAKSRLLKRFNLAQAEAVVAAANAPAAPEAAAETPRRRTSRAATPPADSAPARRTTRGRAGSERPSDQPPPSRGRRSTS